ncbi:MAG TPA: small ribosomal subunit Rsm22 family protein [Terriglobales bacterium]|nr:small ribosomal subunit Rsm22 family protein [Terriglobales bacterium]
MQLPRELQQAIQDITTGVLPAELARSVSELTASYREKQGSRPPLDAGHRAAYLVTRLPATHAVLSRVLHEAKLRVPELRIESMLDLGTGPGTAMWAAVEQFPELALLTAVEDSAGWIEIGKRFTSKSENAALRSAEWQHGSITDQLSSRRADLVTMSYVVHELRPGDRLRVVQSAWERAEKLLVIVEPGTPEGFEHIREMRRDLVASGANIAAPCPHGNECPLVGDNWCHFAERVQRMSAHRMAKGAELGYEDEKYSYLIVAREQVALADARILRHPQKHSGHIEFELCTNDGLKRETVSRKQGERYRTAKKAKWGDTL